PSRIASVLFYSTIQAPPELYTLSLHDALPISNRQFVRRRILAVWARNSCHRRSIALVSKPARTNSSIAVALCAGARLVNWRNCRSEEHTSELQSRGHLVCRLLLEKKKQILYLY